MSSGPSVLVTGGSGLLGRAVLRELAAAGFAVHATVHSRPVQQPQVQCHAVDLMQPEAVHALLASLRPSAVVHCAAERRPDVVDEGGEAVEKLNADLPATIARVCNELGIWLIHMGSDYVFDGSSPPYGPDAPTNPMQTYGRQKLAAEQAVLSIMPSACVLRVPLLFGHTTDLSESSLLALAKTVIARDKTHHVDDWSHRYPTFTDDVAVVIRNLLHHHFNVETQPDFQGPRLAGPVHWSSNQTAADGRPYTKYSVCLLMGDILSIPTDHIHPAGDTSAGGVAPRPKDCHLDSSVLRGLGYGQDTDFRQALTEIFKRVPELNFSG